MNNEAYNEAFERDGVILCRDVLPKQLLKQVIGEYEATDPDVAEIPKHRTIVVFWTHIPGTRKQIKCLSDMPFMSRFAVAVAEMVRHLGDGELRLLETIIFNKPPGTSNTLRWHQDVSYFPFNPNNQLAAWIPFDFVIRESGAMIYALGTHKMELRASSDLHSGRVFDGEDRASIPDDPETLGIKTRCFEMAPGDMLIHDGRTWHMSGPNTMEGRQRRGLSLRFLVGDTYYHPRPGSAAAFMKQIDIKPGDKIDDPAFPIL